MQQRPLPRIKGPVSVHYTYGRPDRRRRDLGNLEKAVSDLLVDHGIIEDDSLIESILLDWSDDVVGVQVEAEVCRSIDDVASLVGSLNNC